MKILQCDCSNSHEERHVRVIKQLRTHTHTHTSLPTSSPLSYIHTYIHTHSISLFADVYIYTPTLHARVIDSPLRNSFTQLVHVIVVLVQYTTYRTSLTLSHHVVVIPQARPFTTRERVVISRSFFFVRSHSRTTRFASLHTPITITKTRNQLVVFVVSHMYVHKVPLRVHVVVVSQGEDNVVHMVLAASSQRSYFQRLVVVVVLLLRYDSERTRQDKTRRDETYTRVCVCVCS